MTPLERLRVRAIENTDTHVVLPEGKDPRVAAAGGRSQTHHCHRRDGPRDGGRSRKVPGSGDGRLFEQTRRDRRSRRLIAAVVLMSPLSLSDFVPNPTDKD